MFPGNPFKKTRAASFLDETTHANRVVSAEEIAAAFASAQRESARISQPRSRMGGRATIACVIFAIAAFGGGLFLAHFSSTKLAQVASSSSIAPESLYFPPHTRGTIVAAGALNFPGGTAVEATADGAREASMEPQAMMAENENVPSSARVAAAGNDAQQLTVNEITTTMAEASRFALAARSHSATQTSDPLLHGYQGVEISAIPEPSTIGAVTALVVAVVASANRKRRSAADRDRERSV